MVSAARIFADFVDGILDKKLQNFPKSNGKRIYETGNYRLDIQGMTTGSKAHNLQIQVQKNAPNTSVAKEARTKPTTVAHVEFTVSSNATPDQVRTAFKRSHEPIKQQKACFKEVL